MHTILGAGGPVANALTRILTEDNQVVRLMSRRPVETVTHDVSWQRGDLLVYKDVERAGSGSNFIYLCAGLKYDAKVWHQQWPVIMRNVIKAVNKHECRLIFFDNIYRYGRVDGRITEDTPYRPCSVKGEVRAQSPNQLMEAVAIEGLSATIARAPDFYGITGDNSFLDSMVINKFAKGERAVWIGKLEKLHNFIYVPDAARAVYTLASHPESDKQIWHLPTPGAISGHAMLELIAGVYGVPEKHFAVNKLMLRTIGLFDPLVKGSVEMYYQYDGDYRFDSSKFEQAFSVKPTSYREALMDIRDRS